MNTHFVKLEDGSIVEIDTHKFFTPYINTSQYWGAYCNGYLVPGASEEEALTQIIKDMKLAVSDEEVEKEISSIQDPKLKQQYDSARGRMNIRTIMLRQKAVSWIRDQVKK